MISFKEALTLIAKHLSPFPPIYLPVWEAKDFVLAEDVIAKVDVPNRDVSLKDGFAVRSEDISEANPENPVVLNLVGQVFAGGDEDFEVLPGTCVRITAGAPLPQGANAVLSEEFSRVEGDKILALADAPCGLNVLKRGEDLSADNIILKAGTLLSPMEVGILAAAGFDRVKVFPRPKVKIIATGDEVVAPGKPLEPGKLYASNLVTLVSWCKHFGFPVSWALINDEKSSLKKAIEETFSQNDVLITSGGAWRGPKDLVLKVLEDLGWQEIFNYVRIGPGKAVSFGKVDEKVIFTLPGGPPSNQMAFLNLALPGLFKLSGRDMDPFPTIKAFNRKPLSGQKHWTQFFFGKLFKEEDKVYFEASPFKSRLSYLGQAEALAVLPEGKTIIVAGEPLCVRLLKPFCSCSF
ncbi:molybdopterin molybdotransferase MoeA [Thermodesulfatator autotrophicus]|uniref:Molybdopterin molybdenumtransferase n=1 Tax=Thermodesulfatator autotrophicus TaxID=1795632 RepID=A0A177ECA5_9BACT|nr:gephyrin-like molybdotransferase Glp [Thermodesulfatator autotrophicus]OAG28629.1 hypothetical protein TH606_00585 [Thermodesulfatator autotrophicus]